MARQFAAKGRDLALCARRTDVLEELKAELLAANPGIQVAVRPLDVNDHDSVPVVFGELRDELSGLDRVVVNAGIAKGWHLGGGKSWANIATIETNLIGALVQIEASLALFKAQGAGHLVLISSVTAAKGLPGTKAAYAASKAGLSSLGESLRAEYARGPIKVSTIEPGYIQTDLSAKSPTTPMMVDTKTGVTAMVDAIEKEPGRAAVPRWPWAPVTLIMRLMPPRLAGRLA